ncbi:MAG: hypothetical protein JNJ77_09520 [Planctomycetia bacterium]|nr:hypothetical protein [Planctomycetia bacterium]
MRLIFGLVLIHVAALVALAWVGWKYSDYLHSVFQHYQGAWSVVSAIGSFYLAAWVYAYKASPRVYLFIQKLKMPLMNRITYWQPHFCFVTAQHEPVLFNIEEIVEELRKSIGEPITVSDQSLTSVRLTIDSRVVMRLSVDKENIYANFPVKLTVPSSKFDSESQWLQKLQESICRVTSAKSVSLSIIVSFEKNEKNPYYGLFVRQLPEKFLKTFQATFVLSEKSTCRIEAGVDSVNVEGKSAAEVFDALRQVISLSAYPVAVK